MACSWIVDHPILQAISRVASSQSGGFDGRIFVDRNATGRLNLGRLQVPNESGQDTSEGTSGCTRDEAVVVGRVSLCFHQSLTPTI